MNLNGNSWSFYRLVILTMKNASPQYEHVENPCGIEFMIHVRHWHINTVSVLLPYSTISTADKASAHCYIIFMNVNFITNFPSFDHLKFIIMKCGSRTEKVYSLLPVLFMGNIVFIICYSVVPIAVYKTLSISCINGNVFTEKINELYSISVC